MAEPEKILIIKPITMSGLAKAYGMSRRTIYNWLQRHKLLIGERDGLFFTPAQVKKIYECLGPPNRAFKE